MWSGNQRRWSIAATLYHRQHAPLERGGRSRRRDDEDVREDGHPRRLPGLPRARRAAGRGRVPDRPPVPGGRPALRGHRLVGAGRRSCCASPAPTPMRCAGPTTARPTSSTAVSDVLAEAGHAPPADGEPSLTEVRDAFEAAERASGAAAKAASSRRSCGASSPRTAGAIVKVLSGELRIGLREGLLEAADREGVRPSARRRQAGRDADRRRRPHGGPGPRGPAGRRGDGPVPPAQVHARVAGGGRGRDHRPPRPHRLGRGQVRRHPGPAPPLRDRRSGSTRGTCTTSAASSPRWSMAPGTCRGPGSSTASCSPGATARSSRSSSSRRGSGRKNPSARIRAEVPVIFVAWDVLGLDRDADCRGDAAARAAAGGAPRAPGGARPPARGRRWPVRAQPPRHGRLGRRPGGGVRRGPCAAQRGADGQGPAERVLARAARAWAGSR